MCRPWIRSMKPWHDLQKSEVRRNYSTTSFLFAVQGSTFYNVVLPRSKLVYIFPSNYVAIACTDHESLVGGLEHFLFFHILGIIIPTDYNIFQRDWNHQPDHFWTFWSFHFFPPWNPSPDLSNRRSVRRTGSANGCSRERHVPVLCIHENWERWTSNLRMERNMAYNKWIFVRIHARHLL